MQVCSQISEEGMESIEEFEGGLNFGGGGGIADYGNLFVGTSWVEKAPYFGDFVTKEILDIVT